MLRLFVLMSMFVLFIGSGAQANRQDEIYSCQPHELATWGDGTDRPVKVNLLLLDYKKNDRSPFGEATVTGAIDRAARGWSECGVPIRLASRPEAGVTRLSRRVVIRWADRPISGIAIADTDRGELLLNAKVFETLLQKRSQAVAKETLQMVLSHELGHFLGMRAHSRRCVDVMSYYTSPSGEKCWLRDPEEFGRYLEYRHSLPTACDIARCRALNAPR